MLLRSLLLILLGGALAAPLAHAARPALDGGPATIAAPAPGSPLPLSIAPFPLPSAPAAPALAPSPAPAAPLDGPRGCGSSYHLADRPLLR
jgi:hypothetical protein